MLLFIAETFWPFAQNSLKAFVILSFSGIFYDRKEDYDRN